MGISKACYEDNLRNEQAIAKRGQKQAKSSFDINSGFFQIVINSELEAEIQQAFLEHGNVTKKALASTLRKYAKAEKTLVKRALAKATGVKATTINKRIKTKTASNPNSPIKNVRFWVGYNEVAFHSFGRRLGQSKRRGGGVTAYSDIGNKFAQGAFLANANGATKKIAFIRKGRKKYPLKKVTLDVEKPTLQTLPNFYQQTARADEKFLKIFQQELNYYVNVKS
ncbi:hypothetical protein AAEX28_12495 [Lentisphaerota bacterium WC36G]|nr:phage tail protein [Lentisphaerae bacterium WC36]